MAGNGRGITIRIEGDGESAKAALAMVQEQMRLTAAEAGQTGEIVNRFGSSLHGTVPATAAASASLRALEGNFTNNIRAGERFLTMLPGMAQALQVAFPYIGAVVLGTALFEMGKKAWDATQNIVNLKSAMESLGQVDLMLAKKIDSDRDAIERSLEQQTEATSGHIAALKQRLAYESGKPIDLSELFYDKGFSGQADNVKANYEKLYKSVAPDQVPEKLARIRTELKNLHGALDEIQSGQTHMTVPTVGGFGPGALQDPAKYYEARIKAAGDVEKLLYIESQKRNASLGALGSDIVKPKGDNSIATAAARLAEEQSKASAEAQKVNSEIALAELESQHKMLLVSDQDFYQERERLQLEALDAQQTNLEKQMKTLGDLAARQHGDKTLRRDKDGNSAQELDTQREMVRVQEQMDQLRARRGQITSAGVSESNSSNQATELQTLKLAADLERERNAGLEAQIALIRREHELEAQRVTNSGGSQADAANVKALGEIAVKKLQIEELSKNIVDIETDYRRQVDLLNDAAAKDPRLKNATAKAINQLNQEEVKTLQALVAQYKALAGELGGDFVEKAKDLEQTLSKLQQPDKKQDAQFTKALADGVSSMATKIADGALKGKQSFHDMAKSIEQDIAELAVKLAVQKWLTPLLSGIGGGSVGGSDASIGAGDYGFDSLPHFANGGDPSGLSVVGEKGPELFLPKGPGTIAPNSVLNKIAESGGGGGRAPNITTNVINQSSQPVTAQTSSTSYDSQSREYITHVILSDLNEGGPMGQAFRNMTG